MVPKVSLLMFASVLSLLAATAWAVQQAGWETQNVGRYQLVPSAHTGVSSIYRIDTATGALALCYSERLDNQALDVKCVESK